MNLTVQATGCSFVKEVGEHQKLWGASHAASPDANP